MDATTNAEIMGEGDTETSVAAPVITVKQGGSEVAKDAKVPHGAENVTFEISAAKDADTENVKFYYNIDSEKTPSATEGEEYPKAVQVTAPTTPEETTVTIKAVAVKTVPATEEGGQAAVTTSTMTTAAVVFAAKGKTIALSTYSDSATIKIGDTMLTKDASYEIKDAANDLFVEVTANDDNKDRLFEVMYKDGPDDSNSVWTSAHEEKDGDNKGKYKIPKARLSKDLVIRVAYMKEITLKWREDANWGSIQISATAKRQGSTENEVIFGDQLKGEKPALADKILAPQDTKVTLSIYPVSGAKITLSEVTLQKGTEDPKPQTISSNKANFTVADTIVDDYTVAIKGTGQYQKAVVKGSKSEEIKPVSGKYNVEPRNTYTLSAEKAGGKPYAIGKVKVLNGSADVTKDSEFVTVTANKKTEQEGEEQQADEQSDGTWSVKLGEKAGGKILKVMLYTNEADTSEVGSIQLSVAPVVTKVTVGRGNSVTQVIGAEESYAIAYLTAEKTSKDELAVKDLGEDAKKYIGSATIEGGKLKVKATLEANPDGTEIELINTSSEAENKPVVAKVKVITTTPAWDKKTAPNAKLAGSTDIDLNLDITLPTNAQETPATGSAYYYKIETKLPTGVSDADAITDAKYYPVPAGKTSRQKVQVINKTFGAGHKAKFNVEITLVQTIEKKAENTPENQADKNTPLNETAFNSKYTAIATSAVKKLTCETKDVYHSEKLTLKKAKAAGGLYTGETNVVNADLKL